VWVALDVIGKRKTLLTLSDGGGGGGKKVTHKKRIYIRRNQSNKFEGNDGWMDGWEQLLLLHTQSSNLSALADFQLNLIFNPKNKIK
jgi:hypothetical protein